MAATTSDKVGWIVGIALAIAMAIFVLWPSFKKKKKDSGAGAGGQQAPANVNDPQVDAAGVPAAGAPVDQLGANRQVVGAAGMPPTSPPSPTGIRLQPIYAPPI